MIAERYGVHKLGAGGEMVIPSKGLMTGVQLSIYGYARSRGWKVCTRHVTGGLWVRRIA